MDIDFILQVKNYRDKYNRDRLPKSIFLYGIFSRFRAKTSEKYPEIIIYFIGDKTYAIYDTKTKYFYYCYHEIHLVLESEFGLNEQKIKELIQGKVDEHLKLGVVTPVAVNIVSLPSGG